MITQRLIPGSYSGAKLIGYAHFTTIRNHKPQSTQSHNTTRSPIQIALNISIEACMFYVLIELKPSDKVKEPPIPIYR